MTTDSPRDTAFEMATSNLRFGPGATEEIGMDLADLGTRRVLVITDPLMADLPPVERVRQSLQSEGIRYEVYAKVRVEPTDVSMQMAVDFARQHPFDALVAVGGGSSIDTAKFVNLYTAYPADFLTYVNAPIGEGRPVPGALKPLIAVPTTAGTGSETTGTVIFDIEAMHCKTGIAHRLLKPALGIVDPENTRTMPPLVAASTGLDVLCHAVESYTALPFAARPRPSRPTLRPAYQGCNPISDIWAERSIELVARYLLQAVEHPEDDGARGQMLLASAYAGMGFGNAGVHLCHGMSYPVSGMVRDYQPPGYPADHPIVPHGISVVLHAPAVFRFTAPACADRHRRAAELLGQSVEDASAEQAGEALARGFLRLLQRLGLPNGLAGIGFTEADAPQLAVGADAQHRVTKLSPRPASQDDLRTLFEQSCRLW